MLIDHTNNALITPMLNGKGALLYISNTFSIIGRIAFPIFMFFLIEGFFKTRNRKKYLASLLIFGLISEIPFDMFVSRTFFEPNWNNMMFTLSLCLGVIWLIDSLRAKLKSTLLWSILGFGLTLAYNGERGRQYKWLNYAFYPVHLLILGLARFYLNI